MNMRKSIKSGWRVFREEGFGTLLGKGYMTVLRPILPQSRNNLIKANGVIVEHKHARFLDTLIGMPSYESEIVDAMQTYLQEGDSVVEIGSGMGVTTVWAARQVGETGCVLAIEGSQTGIERLERTLELNKCPDVITTEHSIVGKPVQIRDNNPGEVTYRSPDWLPNCEALVLDCEGSETEILKAIAIRPRVIIVETHAHLQAPASEVRELLDEKSYDIVSCVGDEKSVAILVAVDRAS
jgi:hypothetical protein